MRGIWLLLALSLTGAHLVAMAAPLREAQRRIEAKEDLRRLTRAALKFFSEGVPPTGLEFWKAIKRERPLLDPWGTPYSFESTAAREYFWRSAGPDRRQHSGDDLLSKVPFDEGLSSEPSKTIPDHIPPSTDAI